MGSVIGPAVSGIESYNNNLNQSKQLLQLGKAQSSLDQYSAGQTRVQGVQDAEKYLVKGGQTVGAAQTAFATSGVDGQTGSAASALEDSRMFSSLDARTALNNESRKAWGYDAKGAMDLAQSQLKSDDAFDQGNSALTTGMVTAWGNFVQDGVGGGG